MAVCMRGWWPSQGDTGEGWWRPGLQAASARAGWGPESVLCSGCSSATAGFGSSRPGNHACLFPVLALRGGGVHLWAPLPPPGLLSSSAISPSCVPTFTSSHSCSVLDVTDDVLDDIHLEASVTQAGWEPMCPQPVSLLLKRQLLLWPWLALLTSFVLQLGGAACLPEARPLGLEQTGDALLLCPSSCSPAHPSLLPVTAAGVAGAGQGR